jgi:alkylation response protein AidB-like acyl-CoA dehydrogenase
MKDEGIVEFGQFEGKKVLGIRLNFEKRYITLGPVATVMGLAFKLRDPENHLGGGEERGITVALLPTSTPGVRHGDRHVPLFTHFQNGPLYGEDVFIPLEWILGGPERIGQGWKMLMTALAAGRGISLPSQSAASAAACARATGAYARVRRQFNVPIGKFEGIQVPLAEICANAYLIDAARRATVAALDEGHKPSVISAIMKYHATERMRRSVEHAMDIHGGKGIIEGPKNYLASAYRSVPIGITVEGANILTRNLMIFGQGAIRSHPHMLDELLALSDEDKQEGLEAFDRSFWSHVGHSIKNSGRAFLRGWSGGLIGPAPVDAAMAPHWRQLSRYSAAFALLADLSLLTLGGALKRKEMISARLGDILSEIYLLAAALKRFEDEGRHEEDRPIVDYLMITGSERIADAFEGVLQNLPARWASVVVRLLAFPGGFARRAPADRLVSRLAEMLMVPGAQRDRLTVDVYLGEGREGHPMRDLEEAFELAVASEPAEKKMREAKIRDVEEALAKGAITVEDAALLNERARRMTAWWPWMPFRWRRCPPSPSSTANRRPRSRRRHRHAAARPGRQLNNGQGSDKHVQGESDFEAHDRRARPCQDGGAQGAVATRGLQWRRASRLYRGRRAHALPAGARQARPVHSGRSRGPVRTAASDAPALCARRLRPGGARLRQRRGRRDEPGARGGASPRHGRLDARLDGADQLRHRHAGHRRRVSRHRGRQGRSRAGRRHGGAVACAAGFEPRGDGMVRFLRDRQGPARQRQRADRSARPFRQAGDRARTRPDRSDHGHEHGPDGRTGRASVQDLAPTGGCLCARKPPAAGAGAERRFPRRRGDAAVDRDGGLHEKDDGVRPDSSMDKLAKLDPVFEKPYGKVTPGNSSQITDGASWVILASEEAVKKHKLTPLARLVDSEWSALDPAIMGLGPTLSSTALMKRHELSRDDIGLWELNEAFAAQVLGCLAAWEDETYSRKVLKLDGAFGAIDRKKLNVDGGAISLGHPVGTSGNRIVLHLVNAMRRLGEKRGIATECIGGGLGGAMLIEAV